MTLVAGTPHFVCRCPNGDVKPFCLGPSLATTGESSQTVKCCCNGKCCGASAGRQGLSRRTETPDARAESGCCRRNNARQSTGADPRTGTQVSGTCCTKTLVQPKLSLSNQKTSSGADEGFNRVLVVHALTSQASMSVGPFHDSSQDHYQRPPPTDLVVTFLHLLI
jgi:hypothetical protein